MRQLHRPLICIGAMLMALLFCLGIVSLAYGWYVHLHEENFPPILFRIIIPLLLTTAIAYPFSTYLVRKVRFNPQIALHSEHQSGITWGLTILLVSSVLILFQPASSSIRYNVGKVLHLDRVDSLPPYVQPTFLSLGEWHVDRLRVIPIHTYEQGKLWNRNTYYLKSFFLLPMFSKSTAYQGAAKAWLAFTYEHTISAEDFHRNRGQSYFQESQRHFKKINVGGFLYFEQYPPGKERAMLMQLARNHSYFQRSYSNIYFGQAVDRDWISLRYFFYFAVTLLLGIIPLYFLAIYLWLRPIAPASEEYSE